MGNFALKTNPSKNLTIPAVSDDSLKYYLKEISSYKQLTAEEELEISKKAKEGCVESKQALIQSNLKLVVNMAKKIVHASNLPMIDLIQEGNLGLMVAADKFNYKLGYRFSTYASWWIKQAIFKAISEQSHSMKIPVYIQETLSKFSKIKSEMEQKNNKAVKVEEVASKMKISSEKIETYLNAYSKTFSLEADYDLNGQGDVCLGDIIEDKKTNVQGMVEYEALQKDIFDLLNCLKEREQQVLKLRFGLGECSRQTLEEIGNYYGVTKECIRQTESRALKKLKSNQLGAALFAAYVF